MCFLNRYRVENLYYLNGSLHKVSEFKGRKLLKVTEYYLNGNIRYIECYNNNFITSITSYGSNGTLNID